MDSMDIICDGLTLSIGNGNSFIIGLDPWPRRNCSHILSLALVERPERDNIRFLSEVRDDGSTSFFSQGWKTGLMLGLSVDHSREWGLFVEALHRAHIHLTDVEDHLVWDKTPNGIYSPRVGYSTIFTKTFIRDIKWWWKSLWKIHCPAKNKLLGWAILEKKVSTWDVIQKRTFKGHGCCSLCKQDLETSYHLFLRCHFAQEVWNEILSLVQVQVVWEGFSLDETLHAWWQADDSCNLRVVPFIISWGVWIARNEVIFNNRPCTPVEIAIKVVGIIAFFSYLVYVPRRRVMAEELINKAIPLGYFDGAFGGVPVRCGGGGLLFLNEHNFLHIKARSGGGTNNFAELMALRKLMTKAWEWGVDSLQIFGDYKIIIDWENGNHRCNILCLRPLLDEMLLLKSQFDFISFSHVYRERNSFADRLSKEGA